MSSINTDLGIGNLTLEDLEGMTTEQMAETLAEAMRNMTEEERAAVIENLPDQLSEIEDSLYLKIEDLEEEIAEFSDNDDDLLAEKSEEEIEEIEEMIDMLSDVEGAAGDANTQLGFYHQTFEQSGTVEWNTTDYNQVQNGEEVYIEVLNGGAVTGVTGGETDTAGLPTYSVNMTINLGYDKISLNNYDASTKTATFVVTCENGTQFYLKLQGPAQFTFVGNSYTDVSALETWPDELLQMCYDGTSSFFNRVHGDASEEVMGTSEVGEEILTNFDTDVAALNELLSASTPYAGVMEDEINEHNCRSALSSEEQALLKEMLQILFGTDLHVTGSQTTMAEAWEQIQELMSGLEMDAKNKLYGSLVYFVGKYDAANYDNIFITNIQSDLSDSLKYYDYAAPYENAGQTFDYTLDAFSRAMILINESFSATNLLYGGVTAFLAQDVNGDLNTQALTFLDAQIDGLSVQEALSTEQADSAMNPYVDLSSINTSSMKNSVPSAIYLNVPENEKTDSDPTGTTNYYSSDNITLTELQDEVNGLFDWLANPPSQYACENGQMTADVMRTMIKDYTESLPEFPNYHTDDVLCVFFYTLGQQDPDLLNTLCLDQTWASEMWGYMNEGGWQPALLDDVQSLFQAAGVATSAIQ